MSTSAAPASPRRRRLRPAVRTAEAPLEQHLRRPPQHAEIDEADDDPRRECGGGFRRQPDGMGIDDRSHCRCIHRQADQNPSPAPSMRRGALKKTPVPKW